MTNETPYQCDNSWLNDTPFSDRIWLSMLVDGELSVSQRQAYVVHIAENHDWQKVATAFLDEQVLVAHVVSPVETDAGTAVARPIEPRSNQYWLHYLAMAACLLVGLIIGPWLRLDKRTVEVADVPMPSEPIADVGMESAEAVLPSLPGLYQVSNTAHEAVYYAEFSLPQFMLDALVLAGHRVTFDQEFLGYTETSDNPAAVPINVIHIQKYGRLLAALE